MKLITWKELTQMSGDVVWSYYITEDKEIADQVYIEYNIDSGRLCEESFPITIPDCGDCVDRYSTLNKFSILKEGTVSNLETSGDVINRESDDQLVVVYNQEDIDKWITKLQSLKVSNH